ncbi:hypothetical protein JCM11251_001215 [Rhodosporidiobolus azoricus]
MATAAYIEPGSPTQRLEREVFPLRTVAFDVPASPPPRYAPAIPAYAAPASPPSQPSSAVSPAKSPRRRFLGLFRSATMPPPSPKATTTVAAYQLSSVPPPPAWEEPLPQPVSPPALPRRRSSALLRTLTQSRSDCSLASTFILIGGLPTPAAPLPSSAPTSPPLPKDRRTSMYGGTFNVDLRTALVLQEEQNALRGRKEGKEKAKRLSLLLSR